jgi:hypothetical protein
MERAYIHIYITHTHTYVQNAKEGGHEWKE